MLLKMRYREGSVTPLRLLQQGLLESLQLELPQEFPPRVLQLELRQEPLQLESRLVLLLAVLVRPWLFTLRSQGFCFVLELDF